MFFYKKLRKDMLIEPMCLGPNLMNMVKERIYSEVEGTCLGKLGYVVSVSASVMSCHQYVLSLGVGICVYTPFVLDCSHRIDCRG